jgi:putative membrane protein
MTRHTLAARAAMVTALLAPVTVAANPNPDKTPPADVARPTLADADVQALTALHATNTMEIAMGNLAKTRGGSKPVKAYGQLLVTDHQKADKEVLALAKKHGVTLADHPTPRDDAEKAQMEADMATMEKLKTLDGAVFDREFLTAMVDGHARTLAKIDAATPTVTDAKVKALLAKVRPVVQKHHDKAKALATPSAQTQK